MLHASQINLSKLNDEERKDYYRMMENLRYQRSVIETGRAESLEQGLEEGRAEGREEGRAEERQKAYEEKLSCARNLKHLGTLTNEQIAKALGLTEEDIRQA